MLAGGSITTASSRTAGARAERPGQVPLRNVSFFETEHETSRGPTAPFYRPFQEDRSDSFTGTRKVPPLSRPAHRDFAARIRLAPNVVLPQKGTHGIGAISWGRFFPRLASTTETAGTSVNNRLSPHAQGVDTSGRSSFSNSASRSGVVGLQISP